MYFTLVGVRCNVGLIKNLFESASATAVVVILAGHPAFGPIFLALDWQASIRVANIALGKFVELRSAQPTVFGRVSIKEFPLICNLRKQRCCVLFPTHEFSKIVPSNINSESNFSKVTHAGLVDCLQHLLMTLSSVEVFTLRPGQLTASVVMVDVLVHLRGRAREVALI